MNAELATDPRHSRATIMAEVATALRNSDGTTNIESAIRTSSVSMQAIAAEFGSTRELMLAMVAQLSDSMSAPLRTCTTRRDLRQCLLDFGQRVIETYATSRLRSLYRIAITESIRHTGLGRDFYEAGPQRLTRHLTEFLQGAQAGAAPHVADTQLLASHFLASLRANLDIADTYAHRAVTSPVGDETYVRAAVDLFLHGIEGGRQPCRI